MTLENYHYRTDPLFLRNQFDSHSQGEFKIPIIPKHKLSDNDFKDLLLIGFNKTKSSDENLSDRIVHFFLYDYMFESVWKNPEKQLKKLKPYKAALSPDFSMYKEMNPTLQLYNTFRNRWCGAYFASKGINVIPTVSWGDEKTFEFCFLGIPKGSTVAVSTYMVSEHGNHKDQKDFFLKGYNELLRQVEPERIICYNTPFPEMEGNIVFVDYELSSWKNQLFDSKPSKFAKYISGELPIPNNCDIIIKKGYIIPTFEEKGMGSAYGGGWKPKKPSDERFLGEPGEIKSTVMPNGSVFSTKIGSNGKAVIERHHTNHGKPHFHSNPHDHKVSWDKNTGAPHLCDQTNYDDSVPEFKQNSNGGINKMSINSSNNCNDLSFNTISDFKWCIINGGEVEFIFEGKAYSITHLKNDRIVFGESCYEKDGAYYNTLSNSIYDINNDFVANDIDTLLNCEINAKRLKDIIKTLQIVSRSI